MDQLYQSTVYLNCIRSPTKSVKHCCSGQTQLERISKNLSFRDLQFSLNHSKMLKSFLETHPLSQKFNQEAFQQLCHIKNISNQQNKFYLRKSLKEYQSFRYSIKLIQQTRKLKYNKQNSQHQTLLLQLWKNLKPKQQLTNRISNQWIDIGFQVNDPATDFRGAGFLGLLNLVKFSRNKKCKTVFHWAINKQTQYFFCSAGLFFTMLAVQMMKQMKIPVQFWIFQKQQQIGQKNQLVYNMLFMEFDKFWQSCDNKSIMQFNTNLQRFKSQIKTHSSNQIKQKIIYWEQV